MKVVSRLPSSFKAFITSVATLALVACGGGGGGTGGGFLPDSGGGAPTPAYELTVSATDANGVATNELRASSPLTISVLVEDTSTNTPSPVSGVVVELVTEVGKISPENGSAITDANGIAEFGLEFSGVDGAGTVTAIYTTGDVRKEFNVQSIVEEAAAQAVISLSLEATNSTGASISTISQRSPATLTATLVSTLDGVETPIEGEIVTLETDLGIVTPANLTSLTGADGIAIFTIEYDKTRVDGAGSARAFAVVENNEASDTVNMQSVDTGAPYEIMLSLRDKDGNPSSTLSANSPLTVIATINRINGGLTTPVGGEVIELVSDSDIGDVVGNGRALTNEDGEAEFTVISTQLLGAGFVTASYVSEEGEVRRSANIQSIAEAVGYSVDISAVSSGDLAPQTFSQGNPLTVSITLRSPTLEVSNQPVSLEIASPDLGVISPANGSKLTDSTGTAVFQVAFNNVLGAGLLTARYGAAGAGLEVNLPVEAVDAELDRGLKLTTLAPDQSVTTQFSVAEPMQVKVQLLDAAGTDVKEEGVRVTLESTIGDPEPSTRLTDMNGVATFTLSADGTIGAGTIIASIETAYGRVEETQAVQAVSSEPYTLTLTADRSDLRFGQDIKLTVTLRDPKGELVVGEIVEIEEPLIGDLDRLSAVTNSNGQATFTLSYSGQVGAGLVTARFTNAGEFFEKSIALESLGAPYELSEFEFRDLQNNVLEEAIVSSEFPYTSIRARVVLEDQDGNALANRLIQFTSEKGELTPLDGYVLTNGLGLAEVEIAYTDSIVSGAGQISASYVSAFGTVSVSGFVQAVAPDLLLGSVKGFSFSEGVFDTTPTSGNVVNQGSAVLRLDIINANALPGIVNANDRIKSAQTVAFSSFCLDNGLSSLFPTSPVTTTSGEVSVKYTAGEDCTGEDEVVATLLFGGEATTQTASQVLTIAAASETVSIETVDVTPLIIAIEGTGAITNVPEVSTVRFRVVDANGAPVDAELVNFSLSSVVGGVSLAATSDTSGVDGIVTATVNSGSLPVQTRVTAELDSTGQVISSEIINVSTGIPDQDSFTLFVKSLAIANAADTVGIENTVSVRLADRYNNPVPDGAFVYFTTEYGRIDNSCEIVDGICSVVWISQDPFPSGVDLSAVDCDFYDIDGSVDINGNPTGLPDGNLLNDTDSYMDPCPAPFDRTFTELRVRLGFGEDDADDVETVEQGSRSTILASTTGEESFVDRDGNGLYSESAVGAGDPDELGDAVGEPFLDANEDGKRSDNEYFIDSDAENARPGLYDNGAELDNGVGGANIFTGVGCAVSDPATCSDTTLSIFDNITTVLSPSSDYYIALVRNADDVLIQNGQGVASGSYVAYISDRYNNQPATGAVITVTATGECQIRSPGSYTVPNGNAPYAYSAAVEIGAITNVATTVDTVTVSITNPNGTATSQSFPCTPL